MTSTSSLQQRIIKPDDRFRLGFSGSVLALVRGTLAHRHAISQLFYRDFFAAYRRSFVGATWLLLTPVAGIISWLFLHYARVLTPGGTGVPYPVYVMTGTVLWSLFGASYRAASETLTNSRYLLMSVNLAHSALFVEQILVALANSAITISLTLGMVALLGVPMSWKVVLLPFVAAPLVFAGAALGLLVSIMGSISYDTRRIATSAMAFLMIATPVVYSVDAVSQPILKRVVLLNPLSYLLCSARNIVLEGTLFDPLRYIQASAFVMLAFLLAWRIFYVTENRMIERMF